MKGKLLKGLVSLSMIAACSMMSVMTAAAESESGYSAVNDVWAFRAVADVQTSVNIRAYASEDSAVVGYLTKAASADILERGENWSLVISGGVQGYVNNEYLAFGDEAEYLANVYGMPGVKTYWDGVYLFDAPSAAADIIATAYEGQEFEVISNDGIWVTVQLNDDSLAYVPAEDVMETIILDRAVSAQTTAYDGGSTGTESYSSDAGYTESYDTSYEESYTDTYYEESYDTSYEESYTDSSYDTSYTDTSYDDSYTDTSYDDSYTPETSAPETESASTSSTSSSSVSASDRELLAGIIYCEAGNQSRTGKVAVGAVVMNRVASSSFANTISGVIYESGQFTPAGSGWLDSVIANGAIPSDCYEAADAALAGENPVGDALYFNGGSGKGMQIGDHQFY